MKKEKCILCEEEVQTSFLDKPVGTIVKIKKDDKNEQYLVCCSCQKQGKGKKDVLKLFS